MSARNSAALWHRNPGFFSSAFPIAPSSASGSSGLTRPAGGGIRFKMASKMTAIELPANAC
jgi:hypothetical protein